MAENPSAALEAGRDLTSEEAQTLCEMMLLGYFSDQDAAKVLVRLAEKGETAQEVHGFVVSLLSHAESVPFEGSTVDTCGTGGSGLVRFNVSTTVAFVVAAGGVCVAKHGNRGSSSPNGSFDLLEALGVQIDLDGQAVAACLSKVGLGFIYARRFHPVMKRLVEARKLAARRTIFNLAAPLSNPSRVRARVVGAATNSTAVTVAKCLGLLGLEHGLVICGNSGIDDVDLSGPVALYSTDPRAGATFLDPTALGLTRVPYEQVPGGDADVNAALFLSLLDDQAPQSLREIVCLSAAVVFSTAGRVASLPEGLALASELLATGAARDKFAQYRSFVSALHSKKKNGTREEA